MKRILLTILTLLCAVVIAIVFVAIQKFVESLIGAKATFILGMFVGGVFVYKFIIPELVKKDD